MKHTPGPWHYGHSAHNHLDHLAGKAPDPWFFVGCPEDAYTPDLSVAIITYSGELYGEEVVEKERALAEANARLIAAAPDLLEACKEAHEALKDIINAADNGEPYNAQELHGEFLDACNKAYRAVSMVEA